MKLYTAKFAPNPRRVEIYLKEKGIELDRVVIDMLTREQNGPAYLAKNPLGLLPALELDDGRILTESVAICEYLEELHPEPVLIGSDAWQRAQTREASRIAELGLLLGAVTSFQHSQAFFADRVKQSPDVAEAGRKRFALFLRRIDGLLADREWLAGSAFTIADITAICAIDFGKVAGCVVDPDLTHVARWLEAVRSRPSCSLKRKKKS